MKQETDNKLIVITHSEDEVEVLKPGTKVYNIGFWGFKTMNYDTEWHWLIGCPYKSGTSGYKSLESMIARNPGAPILTFNQFLQLPPTPSK